MRNKRSAPLTRGGVGKGRRLIELGKDLLLLLLVLSAAYLALRGQIAVELVEGGEGVLSLVAGLFNQSDRLTPVDRRESQPIEVRPLRLSVHVAGVGTYGVQYDTAAADKLLDKMFTVLGEALGSAGEPTLTTEQAWREALVNRWNLYLDFQGQVPLAALYAWTEAGPGGFSSEARIRRLLLAEDESGRLTLYYSNEATGLYYACETADTLNGHLQTAVSTYAANANDTTFAFEHKKGEGYEALWPYVMLPESKAPTVQTVYRTGNPISGGQNDETRIALIKALGFHPQANTSYVAGGKQVVKEGVDTLALYDNGAVEYHSASPDEPKYPVGNSPGVPSLLELVEATQPLAEKSVGAFCGDARMVRIYLQGITELGDGRWQVDYGYQINGMVVQLGDEGFAARFVVSDGQIRDFYFMLRMYTATVEQAFVLPEVQAAAAMGALNAGGKELLLAYVDGGGTENLYPIWIAQ